jgi:hypothetical protein
MIGLLGEERVITNPGDRQGGLSLENSFTLYPPIPR